MRTPRVLRPQPALRAALYHRASTLDQDPALCRRELHAAARVRGFMVALDIEETGSGRRNDRPGLHKVMEAARRGEVDVVMVWRITRFGRSNIDLLTNLRELRATGVRFVATSQGIDLGPKRDAITDLIVGILAALAEFESEQISEGTRLGMDKAKREGRHVGRPRTAQLPDGKLVNEMRAQKKTWGEIKKLLGCERWQARRAAERAAAPGQAEGMVCRLEKRAGPPPDRRTC